VNPASWPSATLDLDGWTLTHSNTGEVLGDVAVEGEGEADGEGDGVAAAGSCSHCEPPPEAPAVAT
jgi:hypothetical protein